MRLTDILVVLDSIAPLKLAEGWDNVGLLVGDPSANVERILLCIDYTPAVAAEAPDERRPARRGVSSRHFRGNETNRRGKWNFRGCARWHRHFLTPYGSRCRRRRDKRFLGRCTRLIRTQTHARPRCQFGPAPEGELLGLGRIGMLDAPTPRAELFARIKKALGISSLIIAGPLDGHAQKVAASAGAAGNMVDDALAQRADLYLTGEIRHHDALRAAKAGMTVVCALHSNSERAALARILNRLAAALPGIELALSVEDRDPFVVV